MSKVNHYRTTLTQDQAVYVLDGNNDPRFRLALTSRIFTQHGHDNTIAISSVIEGKPTSNKRRRLDGETMNIGPLVIRLEKSTDNPNAVTLVFLEKPSSYSVASEKAVKKAAGM
ncbi:hypothetical protein DN730_09730 [Marinomonas piezotolerans]|uniref:Uncharacterized protein n=1 Tax=Marinomonas piezotolerans TaxID=2213058 RepID=A0A370UA63_9GAMM|nr:hypothetical protein [Marinomonas piezotolerans]RDL44655.1 hypothetical protein DN730_09730 [Marinomonas piezotolerans]